MMFINLEENSNIVLELSVPANCSSRLGGAKDNRPLFLKTVYYCFYCSFYCFLKILGGAKVILEGHPPAPPPVAESLG